MANGDQFLSSDQRHLLIENICLHYPRFQGLLDRLETCMGDSSPIAEPACQLIVGPTGAGKSTLMQRFLKQHPADREHPEAVRIPVLSATIPAPATMKNLATRLLHALGDPAFDKGTLDVKTLRLYGLLKACGVRLLILDEFQHFIDRESDKVLAAVSDWLKTLIIETKLPVVLIGLPKSCDVLKANEQLRRRFSGPVSLEPFGWSTIEERRELSTFLRRVDKALPLAGESGLAAWADRFHAATAGVTAVIMKIVRGAAHCAVDEGAARITLTHLAQVYSERVLGFAGGTNPFLEEWGQCLLEPATRAHDPSLPPTPTVSLRKRRPTKPRLSEVLIA